MREAEQQYKQIDENEAGCDEENVKDDDDAIEHAQAEEESKELGQSSED